MGCPPVIRYKPNEIMKNNTSLRIRIPFRRAVTLLALTGLIGIASARTWTSADGSKTFEGELESYDPATGAVTVFSNGKKMVFKQDVLSEEDIEYLKTEATKTSAAGSSLTVANVPDELPAPDGEDADMSKPVQVFIIMGQSNTLEMGKVTDALKEKYPYLANDAGEWTTRKDVRNFHSQSGKIRRDDWLTISGKKSASKSASGITWAMPLKHR